MTRAEQDRIRQRKGEGNKRIAQAARKHIEAARAGQYGPLYALEMIDRTIREVDAGNDGKTE